MEFEYFKKLWFLHGSEEGITVLSGEVNNTLSNLHGNHIYTKEK